MHATSTSEARYYVGLDLHKRYVTACVIDKEARWWRGSAGLARVPRCCLAGAVGA
jgi:hypothetical protein